MSKVLRVRYDAEEQYHLPDWLDLEDSKQVKEYYVKWSILHVFLTDGRHIIIKPTGELDFDTKWGDCCDVMDADVFDLEDEEPEWEEAPVIEIPGIDIPEEDNPAKVAKKVICDIFDKVKAEAEAKAEAANLTRTLN